MERTMPYAPDSKEAMPLAHYRERFAPMDPLEIARRCRIPYQEDSRCLTLTLLGRTYQISHPDFSVGGPATSPQEQILFLRYLVDGTFTPMSRFITYRELPWGETYVRQFTGRCINRLAFSYGNRIPLFCRIMEKMDAVRLSSGDASYELTFMPGLLVRLILWAGDEEFPPNAQILLSDNFATAFATEDVAYVGDILLNRMKAVAAELP